MTALAVALLAGCTPPPVPVPTAPTSAPAPSSSAAKPSTPKPSPTPATRVLLTIGSQTISAVPGPGIDRPTYPATRAKPKGFKPAPDGTGLDAYLGQKIDWTSCGPDKCATVLVPLDYAHPETQAITLSLRKKPATKSPKIGTLFLNPGGPGGSGMDLVDGFETKGLERFDLVGWDPRGVGESTPVVCYGAKETDALNALDQSPDTFAERAALIDAYAAFGKSCWDHSGALLAHISTQDTVRDLDLLRGLVGDKKLYYFGYSYGTQIGATYAEMFGANAGRMVLDSAVDITDSGGDGDADVIQAMGFDLALDHFASWCAARKCSLGTNKKAVVTTITRFLDNLDAKPLKVGSRHLTQSLATTGIAAMLYPGVDAWPYLLLEIEMARRGDGALMLLSSDELNDRRPGGAYGSMFYSFYAISCADGTEKGVLDAERLWRKDEKAAPVFGKYMGPSYSCPLWPVPTAPELKIRGADAPPILIIGATGDSATPYQQAVSMAKQLVSGVLVTYDGEGHCTYGGKSPCVDKIVVNYLVNGKVPKDGTKCK